MKIIVKYFVPCVTWVHANFHSLFIGSIIICIPFSIRYVFQTPEAYSTGAYSDFTSFSLYLSDVLLVSGIAYAISRNKVIFDRIYWLLPVFTWIILEIILHYGKFLNLQLYFGTRLIFLYLLIYYIAKSIETTNRNLLSWIFMILAGVQSIIAIIQFIIQKSIGLYLLGESHLSPEMYGVAKIVAHGTKYIRGYGTFPHSNLLAAFLVVAIILNLYLLTINYKKSTDRLLGVILFLNIVGIVATLSRGGILALLIGLAGFTALALANKHYQLLARIMVYAALGMISGFLFFQPFLLTRATITDNAVKERLFYNEIGKKMIKESPWIGTGIGVSVLHMEQNAKIKLESWEIQPIHNFYIISIAEWGIGSFILLSAIIYPIIKLYQKVFKQLKTRVIEYWDGSLAIIGTIILTLFLFDHYFYTIWPTQLLLALCLGLMYRAICKQKPI